MIAAGLDRDEAFDVRQESRGYWRHGVICREGVELAGVSDNPIDFGHGAERRRVQLGRTAGNEDFRFGPPPMGMADRLARLAHRFVGYCAAVTADQAPPARA